MMSIYKKGEKIVSRKVEKRLRTKFHNEKSTLKGVRMKDLSFSEVAQKTIRDMKVVHCNIY